MDAGCAILIVLVATAALAEPVHVAAPEP